MLAQLLAQRQPGVLGLQRSQHRRKRLEHAGGGTKNVTQWNFGTVSACFHSHFGTRLNGTESCLRSFWNHFGTILELLTKFLEPFRKCFGRVSMFRFH